VSELLGDIIIIDLEHRQVERSSIYQEWVERYLGGRGINVRLLWDFLGPNVHPLAPDNVIIFGAGTLNATEAPSAGRVTVTFKSPATRKYFKSSAGGHFGPALRQSGISFLVIRGVAEKPVYIFIDNGRVFFKDASAIWGQDVRLSNKTIRKELGDEKIQIACIGPAGENRVVFAGIMFSTYNTAARGGSGAVMGSKNLKAIAVRGTSWVPIYDIEAFHTICLNYRKLLAKDTGAIGLSKYGTSGLVDLVNEARAFPSYNFQKVYLKDAYRLSGYYLNEAGYLTGRVGCSGCSISCHRFTRVKSGPYAGTYSAGPEYETVNALGAGCGITDTEVVLKANELCNLYGLDTISTGSVIQWGMECYEKKILSARDLGGPLIWGDGPRTIELIEDIAKRRGFGEFLAQGLKQASEKVGQGSEDFALQVRGLEHSRIDTRGRKGYALAFAVNPRGPDHLHTQVLAETGRTPEAVKLIEEITGDRRLASPYLLEKRAEIVKWHEDCYAVTDALGFCAFATTLAYAITPKAMAQMLQLASGIEIPAEKLMEAGERIVVLEHLFNVREGLNREDHTLPKRLMEEPVPEGPAKGQRNSKEEMDRLLDDYYSLHEWETKTSWPKEKCIDRLGLKKLMPYTKTRIVK
jgi:aldehyde:ferredoxin oxidoreductase